MKTARQSRPRAAIVSRSILAMMLLGLLTAALSPLRAQVPDSSTTASTTTASAVTAGTATTTASTPVIVARLDDVSINPVTAKFVLDQIAQAEREGAVLVLQLDTPGGLLQSTRDIVKGLLGSRVPVVTYVAPAGSRAASAGVFITMASHVAAMAPGTHLGAATPVSISGEGQTRRKRDAAARREEALTTSTAASTTGTAARGDDLFGDTDAMSNKILNDTIAWIEAIAEQRGRNASWAREAVAEARSSTADEALRLNVIDLVATDMTDLLRKLDGRRVPVAGGEEMVLRTAGVIPTQVSLSLRQQILNVLANPSVAYVLLLAGLALIYIEITQPGGFLAGVAGVICLLLAAFGLQMLPTNYMAVILIAAGLGMIVAEVKVTSYGLLTVGGAVCLFVGSLLLVDSPPGFARVPMGLIVVVTGVVVLILATLVALVARTHALRPAIGEDSFVGEIAEVVVPLTPEGKVFFNGTYWDAVSPTPVAQGERVRVMAMDRLRLLVAPLSEDQPEEPGHGGE